MRVRQAALILGIVAVAGVWCLLKGASTTALLVISVYTLMPWAFLALGAKTLSKRAQGVALGSITAIMFVAYVSVITTVSSTEALIFLVIPAYQLLAIGVIWLIGIARWPRGDGRGRV